MIAKGNLHANGGGLARYMLTGKGDEIAELVEARRLDYLSPHPVQAFETLQKIAEANTRAENSFFHCQTRLAAGEHLTDAQWRKVADREEKRLGFEGQPRLVTFHIFPNGERHLHIAWFRIDLETMKAIDPWLYKNHLKLLCRKMEKEFGLREVSNERQPDDKARAADRKEVEEARRLGTDERAIRATILDCLERTDNGKSFRAALDERGLILANGDKRDCFVVIDQAGGHHALNKKLTGLTLAQMRDRLGDLDRSQLPSVEQAKMQQHEKYPTPEQAAESQLRSDRLHNTAGRYDTLKMEPEKPRAARRHQHSSRKTFRPGKSSERFKTVIAAHGSFRPRPNPAQSLRRPASNHAHRGSWVRARSFAAPGSSRPPRQWHSPGLRPLHGETGRLSNYRFPARQATMRRNSVAPFRRAAPRMPARHRGGRRSPARMAAFRGVGFALPVSRTQQEQKSPPPRFARRSRSVPAGSARMPHIDHSDPAAAEGAQGVVAAIIARYAGWIAEISDNESMSEGQKAAAITGLRYQQEKEVADVLEAATERARWGSGMQPRATRRKEQAQDAGDAVPSLGNPGSSSDNRNSTTSGAMRGLFRAAATGVTHSAETPSPKPRRRRGETDKGSGARQPIPRPVFRTGAAARGCYAALQLPKAVDLGMETPSIESAIFSLSLCNSFGGFENEGSDYGWEGFDAPETSANLNSLGL